ncbi:MAG: hypothetical protein DRJ64_04380 [Thermoprotei archaeon]|nr:MAG: hypothetical protein B6U94_03460 [Thermofilum sp. ex4484_79]RLF06512.1 MAG: hypothetical protein DRJ64_04380 [Thermoprotei archaeon]
MRYIIIFLYTILSISLVFIALVYPLRNIEEIKNRRDTTQLIIDSCLIYNNPGSTLIKPYYITDMPRTELFRAVCDIRDSQINVDFSDLREARHLSLLNITSTINLTKVSFGG